MMNFPPAVDYGLGNAKPFDIKLEGFSLPKQPAMKLQGGLFTQAIPDIEHLHIPANMSNELRLEVARNLKALQKELAKGGPAGRSNIYLDLSALSQEQKEDRKKQQNKDAAKRNRLKKLTVVWALVSGIQDLHKEVREKNDLIRKLQNENNHLRAGAPAVDPRAPAIQMIQKLKAENLALRAKVDSMQLGVHPSAAFTPASSQPRTQPLASEYMKPSPESSFNTKLKQTALKRSDSKIGVVQLIDSLDEIGQGSSMDQMSMDSMGGGLTPRHLGPRLPAALFGAGRSLAPPQERQPLSNSQRHYLQQFDK